MIHKTRKGLTKNPENPKPESLSTIHISMKVLGTGMNAQRCGKRHGRTQRKSVDIFRTFMAYFFKTVCGSVVPGYCTMSTE